MRIHRYTAALEYADGGKEWKSGGKRQREDGPAVKYNYVIRGKYWYQNDNLHRLSNPKYLTY